jgi:hypothetical protein
MLVTVADVGALLGIADPSADALLNLVVPAMDRWVKSRCGRTFEHGAFVEFVAGYGDGRIYLRESPIAAVTEVRVDSRGVFGAETIIDPTNFVFDSTRDDARLFYIDNCFPEGPRTVKVSYTAGYYAYGDTTGGHVPTLPEDLHLAIIEEIVDRYQADNTPGERMKSETLGDYSYMRFDTTIDPRRRSVIDRYKRRA